MLSSDVAANLTHLWFTNFAEQVIYNRMALNADANLLSGVPTVSGVYPLLPRHTYDIRVMVAGTSRPAPPLLDFLSVSYINQPGQAIGWITSPLHIPWVSAGQKPIFADDWQTLDALERGRFDPAAMVFLPPECRGRVSVTNSSTPDVSDAVVENDCVSAVVQATQPAMLVVSQSYYHDWRATVDGQATELLRANHAFQAVEVPAGRHVVRLVYKDYWFNAGAALSVITLGGCAMAWFRMRKQNAPGGANVVTI
jgi:hypothetical protein